MAPASTAGAWRSYASWGMIPAGIGRSSAICTSPGSSSGERNRVQKGRHPAPLDHQRRDSCREPAHQVYHRLCVASRSPVCHAVLDFTSGSFLDEGHRGQRGGADILRLSSPRDEGSRTADAHSCPHSYGDIHADVHRYSYKDIHADALSHAHADDPLITPIDGCREQQKTSRGGMPATKPACPLVIRAVPICGPIVIRIVGLRSLLHARDGQTQGRRCRRVNSRTR